MRQRLTAENGDEIEDTILSAYPESGSDNYESHLNKGEDNESSYPEHLKLWNTCVKFAQWTYFRANRLAGRLPECIALRVNYLTGNPAYEPSAGAVYSCHPRILLKQSSYARLSYES